MSHGRRLEAAPGPTGLIGRGVFGTLNLLSGRSKPLDQERPKLSSRRRYNTTGSQVTLLRKSEATDVPARRTKSNYQPPPVDTSAGLVERRRPLTPSPSHAVPLRCDAQEQSRLLSLPSGVLEKIWRHVLGDRTIHLVRRSKKRLTHTDCKASHPSIETCTKLWCTGLKLPTGFHDPPAHPSENFISLLQACRKIYTTTLPLLYRTNSFALTSMESLLLLSTSLPPQHLDSITSLSLIFSFHQSPSYSESTCSNDFPRWERTWRIIGSMKALQELRVKIVWYKPRMGVGDERRFLDELRQVRRLRVFEVELPWVGRREEVIGRGFERRWGEWEFDVKRRGQAEG